MAKLPKKIKNAVLIFVLVLFVLLISPAILINVPYVQIKVKNEIAEIFKSKTGGEIDVKDIKVSYFRNLSLYNTSVYDKKGNEVFSSDRLDLSISGILNKYINIKRIRIIDGNVILNRKDKKSPLNIQFIIDGFSGNKKNKSDRTIKIESIVLYNCKIKYDILSEPLKKGFDKNHIEITNLKAMLGFKKSIKGLNIRLNKISAYEKSGTYIDDAHFEADYYDKTLTAKNFYAKVNDSYISFPDLKIETGSKNSFKIIKDIKISAKIVPSDFKYFNYGLEEFSDPVILSLSASGSMNKLKIQNMKITISDKLSVKGDFIFNLLKKSRITDMEGKVRKLYLTHNFYSTIQTILTKKDINLPDIPGMEWINYSGNIKSVKDSLVFKGLFSTSSGNINLATSMFYDKSGNIVFKGNIATDDFEIAKFFSNENLPEKIRMGMDVYVLKNKKNGYSGYISGKIPTVYYNRYEYKDIKISGDFAGKSFSGQLDIKDKNADIKFKGNFNLSKKSPEMKFSLNVNKLNLHTLNLTNSNFSGLRFKLNTDIYGTDINNSNGFFIIKDFNITNDENRFHLDSLNLTSFSSGSYEKRINISSDLINGKIQGGFNVFTIYKELKNSILAYVPSVKKTNRDTLYSNSRNISLQLDINPSVSLINTLRIPIAYNNILKIRGNYNKTENKIYFNFNFPDFQYKKNRFRNANLTINNNDKLNVNFVTEIKRKDSTKVLTLNMTALDDKTDVDIKIFNQNRKKLKGKISALVNFEKDEENKLKINTLFDRTNMVFDDSLWIMDSFNVVYENNIFMINGFDLYNGNRFFRLDGIISKRDKDTLNFSFNEFDLDNIFDLLPNSKVVFGGIVSGKTSVEHLLRRPRVNGKLYAKDFSFNRSYIGNVNATTYWNNDNKSINLIADIVTPDSVTKIDTVALCRGEFFTAKDSMELNVDADSLNLAFVKSFLGSSLGTLSGYGYGKVRVATNFKKKKIGVYTDAYISNAKFSLNILGSVYGFSGNIHMDPKKITFNKVLLTDLHGNNAIASGILRHQYFKHMNVDVNIKADNLLCMNIPESNDRLYYGKAFCSGNVTISGPTNNILIDISAKTEDNTKVYIAIDENPDINKYGFINFIGQKKDSGKTDDFYIRKKGSKKSGTKRNNKKFGINFEIEATPNAELILITDRNSGDEIRARGNGSLRIDYSDDSEMQLFGNYSIESGSYKFIFRNILKRNFVIKEGSSITFVGDVYNTVLDINAAYNVNAKISDLLSEEELSSLNLNKSSIPVSCVLSINGILQRPDIALSLAYPSADEELKRRILNVINTDDVMNQEIVFLMLFGTFTPVNSTYSVQSSNVSNMLNSSIMSSLSSQFNNMLVDMLGYKNVSFDIDYRNQTDQSGVQTETEWSFGMTGNWLNDRLSFEGNLGQRNDLVEGTNQLIGEFDLNLKMKKHKNWSWKAFNRANDNQYFKSALNTQGVGIVYKENYNSLFDIIRSMFFWKKSKKTSSN